MLAAHGHLAKVANGEPLFPRLHLADPVFAAEGHGLADALEEVVGKVAGKVKGKIPTTSVTKFAASKTFFNYAPCVLSETKLGVAAGLTGLNFAPNLLSFFPTGLFGQVVGINVTPQLLWVQPTGVNIQPQVRACVCARAGRGGAGRGGRVYALARPFLRFFCFSSHPLSFFHLLRTTTTTGCQPAAHSGLHRCVVPAFLERERGGGGPVVRAWKKK